MVANGQWPSSLLVTVEDNDQLRATAAMAYLAMKAAARRDGVTLGIAEPAGAYRSLAVQRDMRDNPGKYNLNPGSKVGLAAVGKSTHGEANRVDIYPGNAWAIRNAARFGFYREFGADDPNHYKHDGVTAVAAVGTVESISYPKESNMPVKIQVVAAPAAKANLNDPAWPVGYYVWTDEGIDFPTDALAFGLIEKLMAAQNTPVLQCFGAEARETDRIQRKIARGNGGVSAGGSTGPSKEDMDMAKAIRDIPGKLYRGAKSLMGMDKKPKAGSVTETEKSITVEPAKKRGGSVKC